MFNGEVNLSITFTKFYVMAEECEINCLQIKHSLGCGSKVRLGQTQNQTWILETFKTCQNKIYNLFNNIFRERYKRQRTRQLMLIRPQEVLSLLRLLRSTQESFLLHRVATVIVVHICRNALRLLELSKQDYNKRAAGK